MLQHQICNFLVSLIIEMNGHGHRVIMRIKVFNFLNKLLQIAI